MSQKDDIIREIEKKYESTKAGLDVSWMANELQWMRDLLRREWPEGGKRPGWVDLVLDDRGMAP